GGHAAALRPLPVEALRLPAGIVQVLHELKIYRIEQLLALPRAAVPSRFGDELLPCLDRALGTIPELLTPEPLAEPLEASWDFEPPAADGRTLIAVIEHLLERLLGQIADGRLRIADWDSHSEIPNPKSEICLEHLGVRRLLCLLKVVG